MAAPAAPLKLEDADVNRKGFLPGTRGHIAVRIDPPEVLTAREEQNVQAVHGYEDFHASHNHMPGSGRTMHVTGTVVFVTGGWSCSLRATEGNTGINPQMLSLDLILDPPPQGTAVPEVLTPCAVEWSVSDPPIEYEQVQFRVVGTDDDPPPVIDVVHPE